MSLLPKRRRRTRRCVRIVVTPTTRPSELPSNLTIKQAAAYTQVSEWTIREAIKRGEIPSTRFGQKLIFIPREYFEARPQPAAEAAQ
jgi:excisionase family DNA binding protein